MVAAGGLIPSYLHIYRSRTAGSTWNLEVFYSDDYFFVFVFDS
jgi:hypothetical protein